LSKQPDENYPWFLHYIHTDNGIFFLNAVNYPRHEQPCIFHWKDAQIFFDFNSGHRMPDSGLGYGKDVIQFLLQNPRAGRGKNKWV
jgi:hypothetical protein